jgi:glycosyltransferase involved in cell wall biosynthesis
MRPDVRVALLATVVEFGGIERVLLTLLRHMGAELKLSPIFFTRAGQERNYFLESLDASGIAYDAIYVDTSRYKYLNPFRNIGETLARIKAGRFDLIHSHGYRADLIGFVVAKRVGLPVISTCHGFISTDSHLRLYNKLDIYLLRYFNRVIAVSERMKRDLVARGVDAARIQMITNAISEEPRTDTERIRGQARSRLGIAQDEFVVGFVGRLAEEKGLAYLLEAVRRWAPDAHRWRLVLVGEGPQRDALEQAVRSFGLAGKVIFAGFQSNTAEWYPAMDAFVLPSLTEGTPMVLLEAMANGIPVIATSVGGVPAIISSGENGILVPPADPSRLLEAMQSVAGDGDLRKRLCARATDLIRRDYNVADWIRKVAGVYTATLQESRRGNQ